MRFGWVSEGDFHGCDGDLRLHAHVVRDGRDMTRRKVVWVELRTGRTPAVAIGLRARIGALERNGVDWSEGEVYAVRPVDGC